MLILPTVSCFAPFASFYFKPYYIFPPIFFTVYVTNTASTDIKENTFIPPVEKATGKASFSARDSLFSLTQCCFFSNPPKENKDSGPLQIILTSYVRLRMIGQLRYRLDMWHDCEIIQTRL